MVWEIHHVSAPMGGCVRAPSDASSGSYSRASSGVPEHAKGGIAIDIHIIATPQRLVGALSPFHAGGQPPPESDSESDALNDAGVKIFDISMSPVEKDKRRLCDLLWVSHPQWAPKDLVAAERRLAKVGINSMVALARSFGHNLNQQLSSAGQEPFSTATVHALQRHMFGNMRSLPGAARWRPSWRVGSGSDGKRAAPMRLLCDMLWETRPSWIPSELATAERKLVSVGINNFAALDEALGRGLNRRLRQAGLKAFNADTIFALRRCMDEVYGRINAEDKESGWLQNSTLDVELLHHCKLAWPFLRDLLWECRPDWSAAEVSAAERKLAMVGVKSAAGLAAALASGLNHRLRVVGLKTFNSDTVAELQRRLSRSGIEAQRRVMLP